MVDASGIEGDEVEVWTDERAELGAAATEEGEAACAGAAGVDEDIWGGERGAEAEERDGQGFGLGGEVVNGEVDGG